MFGTSVFRTSLLTSSVILVLGLLLLWTCVGLVYWQHQHGMREDIIAELELIHSTYEEDGIERLIHTLDYGEGSLWDEEQAQQLFIHEDFLIAIFSEEGEAIAGYPGFEPEFGWSTLEVDLERYGEHTVFGLRDDLGDESSVAVGAYMETEMVQLLDVAWIISLFLPPLWLLASIVLAYRLARLTRERLAELEEVAIRIGQPSLSPRASVSSSNDEFDGFAVRFNQMLDRFEALARNLESVSIGVAHDLRTPIANLGGRLQLIERDINDPEAVDAHVQASQDHINNLLRTLEALLRLGDVEAGKRRSGFHTVSLSELTTELCETFEPVFADADKILKVSIAPSVTLRGDEDLLIQMLTNLLENILEHSRDGAQGWISLSTDGDSARILVGDDGPGIPAPRAEQIFERFFRLDASRNTPGNGLGLSLVKAIAELHGGNARLVAHAPGAEIEITLPRGDSYKSV